MTQPTRSSGQRSPFASETGSPLELFSVATRKLSVRLGIIDLVGILLSVSSSGIEALKRHPSTGLSLPAAGVASACLVVTVIFMARLYGSTRSDYHLGRSAYQAQLTDATRTIDQLSLALRTAKAAARAAASDEDPLGPQRAHLQYASLELRRLSRTLHYGLLIYFAAPGVGALISIVLLVRVGFFG